MRHSGNVRCLQLEKAVRANEVLAEKFMMGASLAQRDGEEPVTVLLVLESLFITNEKSPYSSQTDIGMGCKCPTTSHLLAHWSSQ